MFSRGIRQQSVTYIQMISLSTGYKITVLNPHQKDGHTKVYGMTFSCESSAIQFGESYVFTLLANNKNDESDASCLDKFNSPSGILAITMLREQQEVFTSY